VSAHAKTPTQIARDGQELSALSGCSPGNNEPPGERHACSHSVVLAEFKILGWGAHRRQLIRGLSSRNKLDGGIPVNGQKLKWGGGQLSDRKMDAARAPGVAGRLSD